MIDSSNANITFSKRTIYVADCKCGKRDIRIFDPPREAKCIHCGTWNSFIENSYEGPIVITKGARRAIC